MKAARDPWVWGPLFGTAAFQIDNWDRRMSDWAREHTPVFSSQPSAEGWSDDLRTASVWAHYITLAATPGGNNPADWIISKAKGILAHVAATSTTSAVTRRLKTSTDRERLDSSGDESSPSGHTSSWARIEAGRHFPSDTLFGMALGNFIGSFVNDAFLGLEESATAVALVTTSDAAVVQWSWQF